MVTEYGTEAASASCGFVVPVVTYRADSRVTTFEDVCREAVWELVRRGDFERYSAVGRWWYGEAEIDIVGLAPDDDHVLFAECKWTSERVGHGQVQDLREKAEAVHWGPEARTEHFAVFSKSGFVDGLEADLDEAWSLFDLTTLAEIL